MKTNKIVCIGWGSLIWDKRDLKIDGDWKKDGPTLPIEFLRQSSDGRLTLVICDNSKFKNVSTMWSPFIVNSLEDAIHSLGIREKIPVKYYQTSIGVVEKDKSENDGIKKRIHSWLVEKDFDAAVWTALSPKFNNKRHHIASLDECISYLKSLPPLKWEKAKEYILNTPVQINTLYRSEIEKILK